jgi:glucokinase
VDGVLTPTDPERRTHLPALVVDARPGAAACACGLRGCLELFASGPAISQLASRMRLRRELEKLQADAKHGRHEAQVLVSGVAGWIVRGIRKVLDPLPYGRGSVEPQGSSVVCLGGGVLATVPSLFESVSARWNAQVESQWPEAKIRLARLGDDAGMIGAAMLASSW